MTGTITSPGIYQGIPETEYHADPTGHGSLSSTEAKRILRAPAVYRWVKDHGQQPRPAFDFGHVVHALVLGTGLDVTVLDFPDMRTKAAREAAAEVREAGGVPVLAAQYEPMRACADAVLTHPVAGRLLEAGTPEQSIFAVDPATGVMMRGRVDWATTDGDGATVLVDLKTAGSADPGQFTRSAASLGYDLQREWYQAIWRKVTDEIPDLLHVVVEKEPPYLVAVIRLDPEYEEIGRVHMRRALDTYHHCTTTGEWPGYPPTIHTIYPPAWYATEAGLDDIEVA